MAIIGAAISGILLALGIIGGWTGVIEAPVTIAVFPECAFMVSPSAGCIYS